MKRYLFGAFLILVALTLVAGTAYTQFGHAQTEHRLHASDGGPIATCRPGANCGPDDELRQMASDGGPIATCRPGANCGPDDQLRQMASDGRDSRMKSAYSVKEEHESVMESARLC